MSKALFGVDETLLIRSLNSTRQYYYPTYIGLRLIGEQLPSSDNKYLQNLVGRRLISGDYWRFREFDLYKGSLTTPHSVEHVYRKCLAPSPLTAFAESMILALFATNKAFKIPSRTYSYHWPASTRSGSSYQYFIEGYRRRNLDIARALNQPGYVAVVSDIKNFYPSVNRQSLERELQNRLTSSDSNPWRDGILSFFAQLLETSNQGIPVGPSSSHFLGHLALHEFDVECEEKYGQSYFRYVDDVVVVCRSEEIGAVKRHIQSAVEKHGFFLNMDKTETLDALAWHRYVLRDDVPEQDNFRSYASDLTVYLAFHPDRATELKTMLSDTGLSIPVQRLLSLSSYSRYRYFLGRRRTRAGLSHAFDLWLTSNKHFLERGVHIKQTYETSLTNYINEPVERVAGARRRQVQRLRRLVNAMFYLRSFDEWGLHENVFHVAPELVEQRALADSLRTGLVNPILPFYGSAPSAFAELWGEHGPCDARLALSDGEFSRAEVDALLTLRLHGIIENVVLDSVKGNCDLRLLGAFNRPHATSRTNPDLSFDDELESLRLGVSDELVSELARSRYALSEGTALDALSLLTSEYRS